VGVIFRGSTSIYRDSSILCLKYEKALPNLALKPQTSALEVVKFKSPPMITFSSYKVKTKKGIPENLAVLIRTITIDN